MVIFKNPLVLLSVPQVSYMSSIQAMHAFRSCMIMVTSFLNGVHKALTKVSFADHTALL